MWCETTQGLEAAGEVIGCQKVRQVLTELIVALVVVAPHRGFLERPIHSLDLTVGPGMIGLGQPVFDAMTPTSAIEGVTAPDGGRP